MTLLNRLGLGNRAGYRPNQLSGGQQQRASIARALINGGHVILADGPPGARTEARGRRDLIRCPGPRRRLTGFRDRPGSDKIRIRPRRLLVKNPNCWESFICEKAGPPPETANFRHFLHLAQAMHNC